MEPTIKTPEQEKAERAAENERITKEAHEMAAQHRARDAQSVPLIQTVADSIKDKLAALPPEEE